SRHDQRVAAAGRHGHRRPGGGGGRGLPAGTAGHAGGDPRRGRSRPGPAGRGRHVGGARVRAGEGARGHPGECARGHPGESREVTVSAPTRVVPELIPPGELTLPESAERQLATGLTVIAIRRATVPLVEVRLRIPFGLADLATSAVLGTTLLSGTATMSNVEIAAALQALGGGLAANVDPDRLLVSGNGLASGLPE